MKVKELVDILQSLDPSGKTEVVFENMPITFVFTEPGFYDGCFYKFIDLESDDIKIKVCGSEQKISLMTQGSLLDVVYDNPKLQVYYDGDYSRNHWDEAVERQRLEGLKFEFEVEQNVGEDWE